MTAAACPSVSVSRQFPSPAAFSFSWKPNVDALLQFAHCSGSFLLLELHNKIEKCTFVEVLREATAAANLALAQHLPQRGAWDGRLAGTPSEARPCFLSQEAKPRLGQEGQATREFSPQSPTAFPHPLADITPGTESRGSERQSYTHVQRSIHHNSQRVPATPVFTDQRNRRANVVCEHNGTLFGLKREGTLVNASVNEP